MIVLTKCGFMVTLTDAKQMPQKFVRAVQGRVSGVVHWSGGQPGWEAGPASPADGDQGLQLGCTLCGAGAGLTPTSPQASVLSRPQVCPYSHFRGGRGHRGWTPSAFAGVKGSGQESNCDRFIAALRPCGSCVSLCDLE